MILVSSGIYYKNIYIHYNQCLTIKSRDGASNTVIDGSGSGPVLFCEGPDWIIIQGFTIRNGSSSTLYPAAGVTFFVVLEGIIKDCIIEDNISEYPQGKSALCFADVPNALVINTEITRNNETVCSIDVVSSILMDSCKIYGNYGDLFDDHYGDGHIMNSIISDNDGDALCFDHGYIENTIVKNNAGHGISLYYGNVENCEVLYNGYGVSTHYGNIKNTIIKGNNSRAYAHKIERCMIIDNIIEVGVAVSGDTINRCIISGNINLGEYYGHGAGVSLGTNGTILNSIIANNKCYSVYSGGAGVYIDGSNARIIHCTITGNYDFYPFDGSGIYLHRGSVYVANSIISSNGDGYGIYKEDGTVSIYSCDFWNNKKGNYGPGISKGYGDISEDPLFSGGTPCNYHLLKGSPCIDSGIDKGVYFDIDGDLRPYGDGFDMGADEWIGTFFPIMKKSEKN